MRLNEVWCQKIAIFRSIPSVPSSRVPGEVLDLGRRPADRPLGYGSPRRARRTGGISGGTLVPRGHGADHRGRYLPSADPGRPRSDGAQRCAQHAVVAVPRRKHAPPHRSQPGTAASVARSRSRRNLPRPGDVRCPVSLVCRQRCLMLARSRSGLVPGIFQGG